VSRMRPNFTLAAAALACLSACTGEEPVPAQPTWVDVLPILRANCWHCHGGGGRPTSDAAAPLAALRWDFYDPDEAKAMTGGTFDSAKASDHVRTFLAPDTSPSAPNYFSPQYMPPPPGDRLTDRELAVLKAWQADGFLKGARWNNHKPTAEWLEKPTSILIEDGDFDPVLGTLTCGPMTINLVRGGGWPLGDMKPPCTAKLFDGFDTTTVQLTP
jgi:hypothetical protein